MTSTRSSRGVVLVIVSGILVLLLTLGAAMLSVTRLSTAGAAAAAWTARDSLAAASGMEYAAARLSRDPYPRWSGLPEGRGDSWAYRDGPGTDPGRMANPSYSHGEPWTDTGGPDGAWAEGEPYQDLDRDGRFTAF